MSDGELQEIAHSGGRISFKHDPDLGTSIGIRHSNPWAVTLHQICVSHQGEALEFVPFGGIGDTDKPYPQPSFLAFVVSDREGMFGRQCPSCNAYFRSSYLTNHTYCPYCNHSDKGVKFLTKNQLQFIGSFCRAFVEAHNKGENTTIDLDALADKLPENRAGWVYSEERQQSNYKCQKCRCVYDILGEYAICPHCATPNFQEVIHAKLAELNNQFRTADEDLADRHEREVEWEKLTRCVSDFEALAKAVRSHLLRHPLSSRRRIELATLNFQNLLPTAETLHKWFDIDILRGLSDDEKRFLHIMFNRRHVFVHNGGKVDQYYLDRTGDTSVRLHQLLRLKSKEIRRLLDLSITCSTNLLEGYFALTPSAP